MALVVSPLLAFFALLFCHSASALIPLSVVWRSNIVAPFNPPSSTAQGACSATCALSLAYNQSNFPEMGPWAYSSCSVSGSICTWQYSFKNSPTNSGSWTVERSDTCPANSVVSGSSCSCSVGFIESGSACVASTSVCDSVSAGSDLFSGFRSFPGIGSSFCPSDGAAAGCASKVTGAFAVVKNGVKSWTYEVTYGGGACTPPVTTDPGVQTTCKGVSGTVNGLTVCAPPSDQNIVESVKSSTTETPAVNPGDVARVEKEDSTSCTGSKCSTTTTTKTTLGDGSSSTAVETRDVPKDDFCTLNPRAVMCATSAHMASPCGSVDSCSGDAVQCAIQSQAKITACKLTEALTPDADASALASAALSGADGLNTDAMKSAAAASSVNVGTFDASGRGWSRTCPSDPVFEIPFGTATSWTMPISRICSPLGILANFGVGITLLASLVWVIGGRKT